MFHIEYQVIKCAHMSLRPADEYIIIACHSQFGQQFARSFAHAAFNAVTYYGIAQFARGGEPGADGFRGHGGLFAARRAEQNNGRFYEFPVHCRNSKKICTRLYK